jgi:hypothetical protein
LWDAFFVAYVEERFGTPRVAGIARQLRKGQGKGRAKVGR